MSKNLEVELANLVSSVNLSIVRAVAVVKNQRNIEELQALRATGMGCQSELDRQLSIRDNLMKGRNK